MIGAPDSKRKKKALIFRKISIKTRQFDPTFVIIKGNQNEQDLILKNKELLRKMKNEEEINANDDIAIII